jgi:hypothetical protein
MIMTILVIKKKRPAKAIHLVIKKKIHLKKIYNVMVREEINNESACHTLPN